MEVLHTFNESYPFGMKKESENTFMELIREGLSQEEISLLRQMSKIYKGISSVHFIRLVKMLREDNKLYFIYEYQETSLLSYIEEVSRQLGKLTKEKYKSLLIEFKNNIDRIIDTLIKHEIKSDVLLANMAYVPQKEDQSLLIKIFIDLDAEYLSLIDHQYRPKDSKKKDRSGLNQEFLMEFYEAERKRLMINYEELLEKHFGKIHDPVERKQFPNFVIQGTKLVFVHQDQKSKDSSDNNLSGERLSIKKSFEGEGKPEEKKGELGTGNERGGNEKGKKSTPPVPIVDFDQSFEPEFKPEEIIKDKTYIYEGESDYLESLQEELTTMSQKKNGEKEVVRKEEEVFKKGQEQERKEIKPIDLTISQGSTQSNPNNVSEPNNRSKDNCSSNNDSYDKKDKDAKLNKYKMKIITSHQIEIEGEQPNVEEIEKEILEGIRTGKINVKDLNQQYSFANSDHHQSLRKDSTAPTVYKSEHREEPSPQEGEEVEKMTASENVKKSQEVQSDQKREQELSIKEAPANKLKTVNDIIKKLGLKTNLKEPSKEQKEPREPKEQKEQKQQNCQKEEKERQKSQKEQRQPKEQKEQRQQKGQREQKQDKQKETGEHKSEVCKKAHQYLSSATTPMHKGEDEKGERKVDEEKGERTENYLNKIKEAKTKAEQLLREYKKKQ